MLNAWRKFTTKKDEKPVFPLGVTLVDQTMQKKYAKGVQYNMKLIIKGDRNTGKSVLLQRLSGNKFKEDYIPTQEIQVSNVNWNYQGNGDVVKTEVWDIVDKSKKKRTPSGSLKISNDENEVKENDNPIDSLTLDAEFIDVYKGTHGVFLIMDITKAWTWKYVQRELEKVPYHIPILILANFRDMGDNRVVDADEIRAYIQHLERPAGSAEVYFTESSMKDGFGLQYVHNFLNMPFLILQRESLMRQLEANTLEIDDVRETLSYNCSSEQQNYNLFNEMLAIKNNPTKSESPITPSKNIASDISQTPTEAPSPITPQQPNNINQPIPKQVPVATVTPTLQTPNITQQQQQENTKQEPKHESPQAVSKFQAYKEKLFGSKNTPVKETPSLDISDLDVVPIEDFNPGMLDNDFLDNAQNQTKVESKKIPKTLDSDDDSDDGNPMVAAYQDFDDSDDDVTPAVEHHVQVDQHKIAGTESEDDDFEDFSSDEEKEEVDGKQNVSIMEQIKARKKLEKPKKVVAKDVEEISVSTQQLDINETEYANLESDTEENITEDLTEKKEISPEPILTNEPEVSPQPIEENVQVVKDTLPEANISVKIDHENEVISDEEDDNEANPYIIAEDVDVENDWMKNNDSDSDKDDEEEDETEVLKEEMTPENDESTTQKNIQFDLDDLEAFMSDQMSKSTVPDVADAKVDSEKPKKKKKKKIAETPESANTEKKRKKKTKTKVTETETPPSKTKTKKSKKVESEEGETKKTTKSKSSKTKKSTPANDLDAFFAS